MLRKKIKAGLIMCKIFHNNFDFLEFNIKLTYYLQQLAAGNGSWEMEAAYNNISYIGAGSWTKNLTNI